MKARSRISKRAGFFAPIVAVGGAVVGVGCNVVSVVSPQLASTRAQHATNK